MASHNLDDEEAERSQLTCTLNFDLNDSRSNELKLDSSLT